MNILQKKSARIEYQDLHRENNLLAKENNDPDDFTIVKSNARNTP